MTIFYGFGYKVSIQQNLNHITKCQEAKNSRISLEPCGHKKLNTICFEKTKTKWQEAENSRISLEPWGHKRLNLFLKTSRHSVQGIKLSILCLTAKLSLFPK